MLIAEVMLPVPTVCEECGKELEDIGYLKFKENLYRVVKVLCYDCMLYDLNVSENREIREAVVRYLF